MPPTGMDLYDRLCDVLDAETEEDLAYKLGVSVRQVQRVKAGFGKYQRRLLDLLLIAGWLTLDAPLDRQEAEERAAVHRSSRRLELHSRRNGPGTP